jgi:hypothetical protein
MINAKLFISLPKESRQSHLDLTGDCLERGGNSTNHKGVLAQFMNSTIPTGRILLCHACHNEKCSNPKHLYWGTDKENLNDAIENGTYKSIWQKLVDKHGIEKAHEMRKAYSNTSKAGMGNKGKNKSEEHKRKISESLRNKPRIVL